MAKNSKSNNLVGKQFGDYKLIEAFAIGGMSQIYKGEDVNLGRIAAVKVLSPDLLEKDSTLVERFQREAKAVAKLEHDNIITIYQYGEQDEHYFLVMKLIQGEDLADVLNNVQRKGQLMSPKRMLHLLSQVASALDYAHNANIIHRDIKPSNILIDKTDRAILTDFGLVLRNDNLDQTMGTAFGTPRYISPEQALASERAVPQSDIYSLAVIVYEILTGEMIYKADTAMGFALSHISEPPPPPRTVNADIPRAVERELLKALDKIPEKRHDSATQFIDALRESYGDESLKDGVTDSPIPFGTSTPVMAPAGLRDDSKVKSTPQEVDTWTLSRDEATPVISPKDKAKVIVEDSPTITEKPKDITPKKQDVEVKEATKAQKRKRGVSFLYVIFSILVIGGVALVGLIYIDGIADTDSTTDNDPNAVIVPPDNDATETALAETEEALVIPEGGEEIVAYYNFNAIAFYNNGENTLNMDNFTIIGPSNTEFTLDGRFTTIFIPPGECVLVKDDSPSSSEPEGAGCQDSQQFTLGNNDVFWRGNEDTDEFTFTIQWNELDLLTCDTVERNDSDTCTFMWTDVEEGDDN